MAPDTSTRGEKVPSDPEGNWDLAHGAGRGPVGPDGRPLPLLVDQGSADAFLASDHPLTLPSRGRSSSPAARTIIVPASLALAALRP